jgi:hypothetical protein
MKINALFSCIIFTLTPTQRDKLAEMAEWYVVNNRGGRSLVDIVGERPDLQAIFNRLNAAGLDPKLIMAWRFDTGEQIKAVTFDLTSYLAVAPDQWDYTQNPPVASRPTTYIQTHAWAGWAAQTANVES